MIRIFQSFSQKYFFGSFTLFMGVSLAFGQAGNVDREKMKLDALAYVPIQKDVVIDMPKSEECELSPAPTEIGSGFSITNLQGQPLRLFLDTNKSGRVNVWSYFRDGIEVYRDMDTDNNGNANECRYFHTAGTRWGIDANEDGAIDVWKQISAEEVAAEVIVALRTQDAARIMRVVLSPEQLKSLELGEKFNQTVRTKIEAMPKLLAESMSQIRFTSATSDWSQFGGDMPAQIPAGRDGNKRDFCVYENARVFFLDGQQTVQLSLGTLINVGRDGLANWRLIDVPVVDDGRLFRLTFLPSPETSLAAAPASDHPLQPLIDEVTQLQNGLFQLSKEKRLLAYDQLVTLLFQIMQQAAPSDRENWCRQLADTLMTAVQIDGYADGTTKLKSLLEWTLKVQNAELTAHVQYQLIKAEFAAQLASGDNIIQSQKKWLADLETFVQTATTSEAAGEAMWELARGHENMEGELDKATKWYSRIIEQHPDKPIAARAAGGLRRLTSVGKTIPFTATLADGRLFDVAAQRGAPVLLYFWDTRCATPAVWEELKKLAARVRVVGISLDYAPDEAKKLIAAQQLPFPMIIEAGGIDSPSAVYWGIPATPMMILFGADGKVISHSIDDVSSVGTIVP